MSAPSVSIAAPMITTMTTAQQRQAAQARRIQGYRVSDVPRSAGRITDLAGYRLHRSAGLAEAIRDFESRVDAPVYVVTLPSIGMTKSQVKPFATRLFNEWRIGYQGSSKGVLVLIVKDVRRIEVEVGQRLNRVVSHSWTTRMLANHVTPVLRNGDYSLGVEKAVKRLSSRIANDGNTGLPRNWYRSPGFWLSPGKSVGEQLTMLAVNVGWCTLVVATGIGVYTQDRRSRTCGTCGGVVTRDRVGKWRTLRTADYTTAGYAERTLNCQKCGEISTQGRRIPVLVESSDGGSYGGDCSSDGGGGGGGDF